MRQQRRTHIGSGEFRVSKSGRESLEACLGSCVGVGIVDRHAHVGGLFHILLPETTSAGPGLDSHLYARSGMPFFLDALQAAGCSPDHMEATVAGGALMGSVSSLDLDLDIGGKTLDVVNQMLKEAGIPVVRSETGGHFGLKLILDLETLECDIEPAAEETSAEGVRPKLLTAQELDRASARIRPIPQVALKIIRTLQSDDYGLWEITQQIRHDQVISAKVLRLCNSAYWAPKEEVKSIDHAVLLLGGRLVGQLILSSAMDQFFGGVRWGYSMSRGGLYHHAVSTAIVSQSLAELTRRTEPATAYTAGLLHDIGKVLLDQYVASASPFFYREVVTEGAELLEVERAFLGVTHEEAGARLADLWSFPAPLRDVIAHHTHPEQAQGEKTLTYLVYLADLLVLRFDAGNELDRVSAVGLAAALQHLGLAAESLPDLVGRIPWKALKSPGYL